MASEKRKAATDARPSKKAKSTHEDKAQRPTLKPKTPANTDRRPVVNSVLLQEEKSFPRGGANVLTPLEQKQIRAQAERDVLFEQATGKAAPKSGDDDGEFEEKPKPVRPAKKRKRGEQSGKTDDKEDAGPKIVSASYKTLVPGSLVLGRIVKITSKDLALALPNNLTGFVPITAISAKLNQRIQAFLETEEDEDEEDDDVDLEKLFHIGQWLRAVVIQSEEASKTKRHIELSIDPVAVNAQLSAANVVNNCVLQASVRSVEDHGIIADLGLNDQNVKGFIAKKELGQSFKMSELQEGQVLMCLVTGKGSDGKVIKLSPDITSFWAPPTAKKGPILSELPDVEILLPGTLVDVLVTGCSARGVTGKVAGLVDITIDALHSGNTVHDFDPTQKFKIGSKTRARVLSSMPTDDGTHHIAASVLSHVLAIPPPVSGLPPSIPERVRIESAALQGALGTSEIIEHAKVVHVVSERGVYLDLLDANDEVVGKAFSHISQLTDTRIDDISSSTGKFKLESTHRARILSFNPLDGLYYVSLQESVLSQPFLRLEDVRPGQIVSAKVEKLMLGGATGLGGVLIALTSKINALVPPTHMSDAALKHPEKKFREGAEVQARILSVDLEKRQIRATLKKTLVKDSGDIWASYDDIVEGAEAKGTISRLYDKGALVQYYGPVKAFLPISEMSEAFISDPAMHFKLGQTVTTRVLSIDAATEQMRVSCKTPTAMDEATEILWSAIQPAQVVSGSVTAVLVDKVEVELEGGIVGSISLGHLADGALSKAESVMKQLRVGQKLNQLVVLSKNERSQQVRLTYKTRFVKDAKNGELISRFAAVTKGQKVHGFVQNITPEGVYVEFAGGIAGLLPKSQLLPENLQQASFGLRRDQTISAWVLYTDDLRERFALTMRESAGSEEPKKAARVPEVVTEAVDSSIKTIADIKIGSVVKVSVDTTKATQVQVRLAKEIQGRIDVSEIFDRWADIADPKAPLRSYVKNGAVIEVKVLGLREAKGAHFLPISHRATHTLIELSAKPSRVKHNSQKLLGSLDEVKVGDEHTVFINNIAGDCVWVNLSPLLRGRIALMDLSDDPSQLTEVHKAFPVGSAVQARVVKVDAELGHIDLTARRSTSTGLTLESLRVGETVHGRVTKSGESFITVQLSDQLAASIQLVELADDFDNADPARYRKNEIVRARVLNVDLPNKRVSLSLRPSLVLSSSLPVKDVFISDIKNAKANTIVRGFVKHIGDKGVVVSLSGNVDAFVRIADLSDSYVKDWKTHLQLNQLVRGRLVEVDPSTKHVRLSLKASAVDENYKAPLKIEDLKKGLIVTGKVRKVEDFGLFIDLDNTAPRLSGLAHRSELADTRVKDARGLYSPGDAVKAKILKIDVEARKLALGLKMAYFKQDDEDAEEAEADDESDAGGVVLSGEADEDDEEEDDDNNDVDLDDAESIDTSVVADEMDIDSDADDGKATAGLATGGFDWNADSMDTANGADYESEAELAPKKKKKSDIKVDMTGELDKNGPRSTRDFERQLLGQPNDSELWIQYMAFHLELSEIQKARDIAERALRTIHIRETDEKANVWIALLNLEVEYGKEATLEEVFKRACQYQDRLTMHEKLASIFIDSGKYQQADDIFERIIKNKSFRASSDVWLNYATFLLSQLQQPDRAHVLLPRAMKSVPTNEHRLLTAKFAALEFRTEAGDAERGRTIFEGLVTEFPKWTTGWDMWVDIEQARVAKGGGKEDVERVRKLYERMSKAGMKKKRAKFVFKRWLDFEETHGDERSQDMVKAAAKEFVEALKGEEEE